MPDVTISTPDTFQGKMSIEHVRLAVAKLESMDLPHKELLADELSREKPALFASFLAQCKFGVSYEKMEFLLNILFVCYLSMKETGLNWSAIAADEVDACMERYIESVKFGMDVDPELRHDLVLQFVAEHPEQALLAYVQVETANWLRRVSPEDSDKYVMLAAVNMVNCIGYVQSTEFDSHSQVGNEAT
jgi:hypothetical protein